MIHDSPPPAPSVRLWLPDPPHAARLAVTAAVVWAGAHVSAAVGFLWIAGRLGLTVTHVMALHPVGALSVVLVTAVAVVLEARRRGETLFYANLGVPPAWAGIVGAAVAGVGELAVWLVVGSGG
jgi:hypothetical protein